MGFINNKRKEHGEYVMSNNSILNMMSDIRDTINDENYDANVKWQTYVASMEELSETPTKKNNEPRHFSYNGERLYTEVEFKEMKRNNMFKMLLNIFIVFCCIFSCARSFYIFRWCVDNDGTDTILVLEIAYYVFGGLAMTALLGKINTKKDNE